MRVRQVALAASDLEKTDATLRRLLGPVSGVTLHLSFPNRTLQGQLVLLAFSPLSLFL